MTRGAVGIVQFWNEGTPQTFRESYSTHLAVNIVLDN